MGHKKHQLTPIKKISGALLLYFYWLQRSDIGKLRSSMISFNLRYYQNNNQESGVQIGDRKNSILGVNKFDVYSDNDLYNALIYLIDSGLLDLNEHEETGGIHFHRLKVTSSGVDIVEGIERGEEERVEFNVTFNFNIENNVTVESLLKAELGSLFRASIL